MMFALDKLSPKYEIFCAHFRMQQVSPKVLRSVAAIAFCLVMVNVLFYLPQDAFSPLPSFDITPSKDGIDWSRFAYVQYVTNTAYLCNSVMIFETLHRLGSKPNRLMMYPSSFSPDENSTDQTASRLLRKARDDYNVKLVPIEVQSRAGGDSTWAESYTKLLAFNQTQYDRVLSLDSDATLLQHMDELFLLPRCPVAIPRAYWLNFDKRVMSSQVVLIQPSEFEFNRVQKSINEAGSNDYDMEIVNDLYKDSALVIPHRPYNLLTGEFRSHNHSDYLGNNIEKWNPEEVLEEAKLVHFSDWPVPKPWLPARPELIEEKQPDCEKNIETEEEDCRAREIWLNLYSDFARRRELVCQMPVKNLAAKRDSSAALLEPAPPGKYELVI